MPADLPAIHAREFHTPGPGAAIQDPRKYAAIAAANAAISIGADAIAAQLVGPLAAGSTQDRRLHNYFTSKRYPLCIDPLLKALADAEPGSTSAVRLREALEFQLSGA